MKLNPSSWRKDSRSWIIKKPKRMLSSVVQKKGHISTKVLACTLITKNKDFELGSTLKDADKEVFLNHPFCSQFCVLGNSSCS